MTVSGVWGDCFYVGFWADGVWIHDSTCQSNLYRRIDRHGQRAASLGWIAHEHHRQHQRDLSLKRAWGLAGGPRRIIWARAWAVLCSRPTEVGCALTTRKARLIEALATPLPDGLDGHYSVR